MSEEKLIPGKVVIYNSNNDVIKNITFIHYWRDDYKYFFELERLEFYSVPANTNFILHIIIDEMGQPDINS